MVYQWKSTSRIKSDANIAGVMCEQLERTVGLSPRTLLDANRSEDAPLHSEFEWDDFIAAESYRLSQAGHIIRMLCIKPTIEDSENLPIRAYFKTTNVGPYESICVILQDNAKRDYLLIQAKKELDAYFKKYEQLTELIPIKDAFVSVFK